MDTDNEIKLSERELTLYEISNVIDTVISQLMWLKVIVDQTADWERAKEHESDV